MSNRRATAVADRGSTGRLSREINRCNQIITGAQVAKGLVANGDGTGAVIKRLITESEGGGI